MAMSREAFNQKLQKHGVPEEKWNGLARQFYKDMVQPTLKGKPREVKHAAFREWGVIQGEAPDSQTVTTGNPWVAGAVDFASQMIDDNPIGQTRRIDQKTAKTAVNVAKVFANTIAGREVLKPDFAPPQTRLVPRVAPTSPEASDAAAKARVAATVLDPLNLVPVSRAATVAAPALKAATAKAAAIAAAKGAHEAGKIAAPMSAASTIQQSALDGEPIGMGDILKSAVFGYGLGGLAGAGLTAARSLAARPAGEWKVEPLPREPLMLPEPSQIQLPGRVPGSGRPALEAQHGTRPTAPRPVAPQAPEPPAPKLLPESAPLEVPPGGFRDPSRAFVSQAGERPTGAVPQPPFVSKLLATQLEDRIAALEATMKRTRKPEGRGRLQVMINDARSTLDAIRAKDEPREMTVPKSEAPVEAGAGPSTPNAEGSDFRLYSNPFDPDPIIRFFRNRKASAPAEENVTRGSQAAEPAPATFDPSPEIKAKLSRLRGVENQLRKAGRTEEADAIAAKMEPYRDVRSLTEERPAHAVDPGTLNASDYTNLARFELSDPEREVMSRLVRERAAEMGDGHKRLVTQDELRERAGSVAPEMLDNLKPFKEGTAPPIAVFHAAERRIVALTEEIQKLEEQIAAGRGHLPADEVQALETQHAILERDTKRLLDITIPASSEYGRSLAFLNTMAKKGFSASYWLGRARRLAGGTADDEKGLLAILKRGNDAQASGDAAGAERARMDLALTLAKMEKTPPLEVASALRKSGMITGTETFIRNAGGSLAFTVLEGLAKTGAAGLDAAASIGTGRRTVLAPTPNKVIRAGYKAATEGAREAWEILRHGLTERELKKLQIPREVNTGNPILDIYINGPFRAMGAADRFAWIYAYTRSIQDQARLAARNERAADRAGRTSELEQTPTDAMETEAIAAANFVTFNRDTPASNAVQGARGRLGQYGKFMMDIPIPFNRVPFAMASAVIDYGSGGAAVRASAAAIRSAIKKSLSAEDQRIIAMNLARGTTGAGLIYMGYKLAEAGMLTGTFDPQTANADEAAGRSPGSILINGEWHRLDAFQPVSTLAIIGSTIFRDGLNWGSAASLGLGALADSPLGQGSRVVADALSKPDKALPKLVSATVGSFVPSLVAEVAKATDKGVDREVDPNAIVQGAAKRLPGLRETLPEKTTALGDPVEARGGLDAFTPLAGRTDRTANDRILQYIDSAGLKLSDIGKAIHIPDSKEDLALTPSLHDKLTRLRAAALRHYAKAISPEAWSSATPEQRTEGLQKIVEQATADAKEAFWDIHLDEARAAYKAQAGKAPKPEHRSEGYNAMMLDKLLKDTAARGEVF